MPWSNAVHYGNEPERRAAYHRAVAHGIAAGYGVGDGAALRFVGSELTEVVGAERDAAAFFVAADDRGRVVERALPVRCLRDGGAEQAVMAAERGPTAAVA